MQLIQECILSGAQMPVLSLVVHLSITCLLLCCCNAGALLLSTVH